MANNKELALKFSYNRKSIEELTAIINSEESSEVEKKVAQAVLDKKSASSEEVKPKKAAPKVKKEEPKAEEPKEVKETSLSEEEEARLKEAEKEFDERQAKRKSPMKRDKAMTPVTPAPKVKKEESKVGVKRENIEESVENPGIKVGCKVVLSGTDEQGSVIRLYRSSDGKEKCMVKIGDSKPIKKRVTSVTLVKE